MENQNYNPQGGGYQPPATPPGKGLAIGSLVLGILSIVEPTFILGAVLSIVGIILAVIAKKKGFTGGLVTAGLVLSIIGVVRTVLLFILCAGGLLVLTNLAGVNLAGIEELLADLPASP